MERCAAPTVAFVRADVIPMDRPGLLERHTVLVRRGRIELIGPADEVEVPADAQTIDATGRFLMPGLADMHMHLQMQSTDPAHLVLYLAEGTTTVRSLSGTEGNGRWRSQVEEGTLVGPTILSADRTIIGGLGRMDPEELATLPIFVPETTEEAAAEARRQAAGWSDLVKVYDGLTPEQYLAAITAAKSAGAYVAGHALDGLSLEAILTSGIDEIAHVDELNMAHWIGFPGEPDFALDFDAIPSTAKLMKQNEVAIVSNLSADEVMYELIFDTNTVLARPEYRVVPPELVERWRTRGRQVGKFAGQGPYRRDMEMPFLKALVRSLHDGGVIITVGTDTSTLEGAVPSKIHRELELLVEAGLSAYEALAAGTGNAATIVEKMGRDGDFGTVLAGRRADLVLLNGNPLEQVSRTRDRVGVMARGVWRTQETLDQMVDELVASYSAAPSGSAGGKGRHARS